MVHRRTQATGYADVYEAYLAAGWTPLPLPRGKKSQPLKGYTGHDRKQPRGRDYQRWAADPDYHDGNIMLVMPEGVVGIDVDVYKGGDKTLKMLLSRYGSLPLVPASSSRTDGSGISCYRVPPGTMLQSAIKPAIEILQYHHRYAVVWPSIHPEGRMYRWISLDGPVGIPEVSGLPDLPARWLRGLAGRAAAAEGTPYDGDAADWLDALPAGRLPLRVRLQIRKAERSFSIPGSRYDAMVTTVARLVHLGAEGLPVSDGLAQLGDTYCAAVDGERDGEAEFWRAVEGAVAKFGGGS
jgi:Bifunctional DNA primase/polymerase, N-terminal